jgi:hypothetical protein
MRVQKMVPMDNPPGKWLNRVGGISTLAVGPEPDGFYERSISQPTAEVPQFVRHSFRRSP